MRGFAAFLLIRWNVCVGRGAYLEGVWANGGEWIGFGEMMDVADAVGGFRSRRWWELDEGGSSPLSREMGRVYVIWVKRGGPTKVEESDVERVVKGRLCCGVLCYAAWQTTIASRPGHCSADYLVVERRPERVGEGDTPVVECGASRSSACRILLS
jgi:hypothetical protein